MTQSFSSAPGAAITHSDLRAPTPFDDLNPLLAELMAGAREHLGDNFVGAYLQGSFALGDFDEYSDVDWLIVTDRDITEAELPALQAFHSVLHDRPNPWAQRLEGSYVPQAILRRWSLTPRDPPGQPRPADWADPGTSGRPPRVYPLLFKGNGQRGLVRSEHDNTQVVRWVLREKGVALAGPPPSDLIDPVSSAALRAEMAPLLREIADWRLEPARIDALWLQAFFVLLCCRMLHTLELGQVTSKKTAAAWASAALDPRWAPLIQHAQATRRRPASETQAPPDPHPLGETMAFLDHMAERAASWAGAGQANRGREIIARALALKSQGQKGHGGSRPGAPDIRGGPRRGGCAPPPIRPGGRGRRG
jgi:hypothetical protein